jgi:hypothetical protein
MATLFVCVFLLTDATETHLFVIWAIADMFLMFVCFILSAEYEVNLLAWVNFTLIKKINFLLLFWLFFLVGEDFASFSIFGSFRV